MSELSRRDREQLARHGLAVEEVERQLAVLRKPPTPIALVRPCTLGDGIRLLEDGDTERLERAWRAAATAGRLSKLVPASGAASRMFQAFLAMRAGLADPRERNIFATVRRHLCDFAFYPQLLKAAAAGQTIAAARADKTTATALEALDDEPLLDLLLGRRGLDLARTPKALIPFHKDPESRTGFRTPLEEHLLESSGYLRDRTGRCRLHLTVGSAHREAISRYLERDPGGLLAACEETFAVRFSVQSPSTDTVAIDSDQGLARRDDTSLLLRPGGHGALLSNLAAAGCDVVVIKNIDNVVPAHRQATQAAVLRRLIGHLLLLEARIHHTLAALDPSTPAGKSVEAEHRLLAHELGLAPMLDTTRGTVADPAAHLRDALARPLRVCGVVRNRGEPGGGPFWVRHPSGVMGRQIVESAEIDRHDDEQQAIFAGATHFNPVLLVCSLRDRHGGAYDLPRFADPRRAFIAEKSEHGRRLRALEHPGLWNGGMAFWNTVFVEVPNTVFAPVKTVLDLLRPEHQPAALDAADQHQQRALP